MTLHDFRQVMILLLCAFCVAFPITWAMLSAAHALMDVRHDHKED